MILSRVLFLTMCSLVCAQLAQADVNIIDAGTSQASVDGVACVVGGGKPNAKLHKLHSICDGGKYDGLVSAMNSEERDCREIIDATSGLLGKDNTPDDDIEFLASASSAINRCVNQSNASNNGKVTGLFRAMQKLCNSSSDQASGLLKGHCYLRASNYISLIISK